MNHPLLKRAAAILAVCAVALSASSVTAFAEIAPGYRPIPEFADYEGASVYLTQKTISMEEAKETQLITFSAKSNNATLVSCIGVHIEVDPGLELIPYSDRGSGANYAGDYPEGISGTSPRDTVNSFFVATMGSHDVKIDPEGTDLFSFKVNVKDPVPGKKYYINLIYWDGDIFKNMSDPGDETSPGMDYAFRHVEQGYIQIEGEYDPSTDSSEYVPEPIMNRNSKPDSSEAESSVPESSIPESSEPESSSESSKAKTKTEWLLGDVNNDKTIDIEDAVLLINNINGVKALDKNETLRGDVDLNKSIDIEDAVGIIGHVNGTKAISGKVSPEEDSSSKASDSSKAADSSKPEESSKPVDSSEPEDSSLPDESSEPDRYDVSPELDDGEYWITIINDAPVFSPIYVRKDDFTVSEGLELFDSDKQPYSLQNENHQYFHGCGSSMSFGVRDTSGEYKEGNKISYSDPSRQNANLDFDPYLLDDGSHHITVHYNPSEKNLKTPEIPEGGYWIKMHNMSNGKYTYKKAFRYKCIDEGKLSAGFPQSSNASTEYGIYWTLEGNGCVHDFCFKSNDDEYKPGSIITVYDYNDTEYTEPLFSFDPYEVCDEDHVVNIYYDALAKVPYRTGDETDAYAGIPELDNGKYWITVYNTAPASQETDFISFLFRPGCVLLNSNGTEDGDRGIGLNFESGDVLNFGVSNVKDLYEEDSVMMISKRTGSVTEGNHTWYQYEDIAKVDLLKYADEDHRIVLNYDGTNWYVE